MQYKKRGLVLINELTGERRDFASINSAARSISSSFLHLQRAALYNGTVNGWRVYEDEETIRKHIDELREQLRVLEG